MITNENNSVEDNTSENTEIDTEDTTNTTDTVELSFSERVNEIKEYLNAMNENEQIAYRLYSELFDMLDSLQDDFIFIQSSNEV